MHVETFNGHSMTGELLRVMVCPPRNAGWNRTGRLASRRELGFHREPDFSVAQEQHDDLCRLLTEAGAELLCLPASKSLTLDAVYTHDASLATDWGLFRYYWIVVKLLVTVPAIILMLVHMQPVGYMADLASTTEPMSADFEGQRFTLAVYAGAALLALLTATVLSTYKPRGRTRYATRP